MLRYDLHVHTDWSDGSSSCEDIVKAASLAALAGIAICDHDTMGAVERVTAAAAQYNLEVIPAVELSTRDYSTGKRVHLVAYYPHRISYIQKYLEETNEKRRVAGEKISQILCEIFPIKKEEIEQHSNKSATIYPIHFMRVLMDHGYCYNFYGPLYRSLFKYENSPCNIPVVYPDCFIVAKSAIESGAVVSLAHPCVYDSFDTAAELARQGLIDAMELDYPRKRSKTKNLHEELIERFDLIAIAGTDYHGYYGQDPYPLGSCASDKQTLDAIKSLSETRK